MRRFLSASTLACALLLTACDATDPASSFAPTVDAKSESLTSFTVPTTVGASEWDYVNIDAAGQELPRTWEHPLGGIISPRWLGRYPTDSSPYTYEQLGEGATDGERLLSVGQQMLQRVIDPFSSANSFDESGVSVSSGSFSIPSTWEHWKDALIVSTTAQTNFPYTVSARYDRGRTVEFDLKEGSRLFGLAGGREPGGFVFIEGASSVSQRNRGDTDMLCRANAIDAITYSNQIPVNTTGAPQGARMKVGVYAQVGEFYLISPTACEGNRSSGQSMVDVEAREFTFFRRTTETAFTVNGAPASPTTTTPVSVGTGPATPTLSLSSSTGGEYVTGVYVRADQATFFADRSGDPKWNSGTSFELSLPVVLHHVVLTTSTGRIARGSISVCASISPSGCQGGGGQGS